MHNFQIAPITEEYFDSLREALASVARERKYLALLDAPSREEVRTFILAQIKNDWPYFVAISEGKVVGWCNISSLQMPVFAHAGELGMGVIASHREHGIGEALLRAVIDKAKARGLTRIQLHVREYNKPAIALYEKFGFKVEGLHQNAVHIDDEYQNQISMALLLSSQ